MYSILYSIFDMHGSKGLGTGRIDVKFRLAFRKKNVIPHQTGRAETLVWGLGLGFRV